MLITNETFQLTNHGIVSEYFFPLATRFTVQKMVT